LNPNLSILDNFLLQKAESHIASNALFVLAPRTAHPWGRAYPPSQMNRMNEIAYILECTEKLKKN